MLRDHGGDGREEAGQEPGGVEVRAVLRRGERHPLGVWIIHGMRGGETGYPGLGSCGEGDEFHQLYWSSRVSGKPRVRHGGRTLYGRMTIRLVKSLLGAR